MSFQFRYQRILDVRELQEDVERTEFAEIQNRLTEEKNKLQELRQELEEFFDQARRFRSGSAPNLDQYNQSQEYIKLLRKRIADQEETVEKWEQKLEQQRQELVEASQKKQVMEALKEQDFEEFQEEVRDRENRAQDEVANRQFHFDDD